ncbi:MAG: hypothetical protein PF503_12800 [Desulfobacula sp.]|jgi:hypothetical protein|nr:hypothetical protein [Desulfobacula sp.]
MKKKLIIAIIILSGISVLGWQIYQKVSDSTQDFKRQRQNIPVAVEVALVKKASIREVGEFTGSLHTLSEFIMAPKIAGRLEKLLVNIGDTFDRHFHFFCEPETQGYLQQFITFQIFNHSNSILKFPLSNAPDSRKDLCVKPISMK